ncbi:MAG: hypothetical protein SPJ90_01630, partial [Prevotella sp.]|nr:hypothetical protein [Prevotellaceae bacterium]MDY5843124.1 hypothetical protein [Prevotella sp.]
RRVYQHHGTPHLLNPLPVMSLRTTARIAKPYQFATMRLIGFYFASSLTHHSIGDGRKVPSIKPAYC